jgi:glycosyltransferase involved in cell wall biosynthesis
MGAGNVIYPKVLIIGLPFDKSTGGGITMSNLFYNWPKDRLALISNTNLQSNLDCTVCERYYQHGYKRKLHPFPLNLVLPRIQIGPVKLPDSSNMQDDSLKNRSGKYKTIYKYLSLFLDFIGIKNALYRLRITPDLLNWINAFNPDIIYSQLSTLELIRFVKDVNRLTGKPIALHMMDDWPMTINRPGLLSFYWGKAIDREFRQLIDKSSVLMSICDAMSEEYKRRYNREFIPFHNPIDIENWLPYARSDWESKRKFTILYAGRIGKGIRESIVDIVEAVNDKVFAEADIILELQTPDDSHLKKIVRFNDRIKWVKPINYSELPVKFASADLLVLPHDFDKASIDFLRYSFSTKVTEYMISGTPILVYADRQTALAKYAIEKHWAYVVTERKRENLVNAFYDLYTHPGLRKELGERAKYIAALKEDSNKIRDNFRKCFILNNVKDVTSNLVE